MINNKQFLINKISFELNKTVTSYVINKLLNDIMECFWFSTQLNFCRFFLKYLCFYNECNYVFKIKRPVVTTFSHTPQKFLLKIKSFILTYVLIGNGFQLVLLRGNFFLFSQHLFQKRQKTSKTSVILNLNQPS